MDAYCYALSTIKKLGYICDTLLYLTDFQPQLFSRRSNKSLTYNHIARGADVESAPLFYFSINQYSMCLVLRLLLKLNWMSLRAEPIFWKGVSGSKLA